MSDFYERQNFDVVSIEKQSKILSKLLPVDWYLVRPRNKLEINVNKKKKVVRLFKNKMINISVI